LDRLKEEKEDLLNDDLKDKANKAYEYVAKSYAGYAFEASVFEAFKVLLESEHQLPGTKNVTLLQVIIQLKSISNTSRNSSRLFLDV